jgi:hypothetical protein
MIIIKVNMVYIVNIPFIMIHVNIQHNTYNINDC